MLLVTILVHKQDVNTYVLFSIVFLFLSIFFSPVKWAGEDSLLPETANWLRAYFKYTWCLSACEDVEGHSTTQPLQEEHLNYWEACWVHLSYQFWDLRGYFLFSWERSPKCLIASYCCILAQFSRKLSSVLEDYRSSSLRVPYCNV